MNAARAWIRTGMMALIFVSAFAPHASATTIITEFIGGRAPDDAVGGGNLVDIFNTAAQIWESAYQDSFTLHLYFGWDSIGTAGNHTLMEQDVELQREIAGVILFDNTGSVSFYLDPTPDLNEEYQRITMEYQNLGGGFINVARLFSYPDGDARDRTDLLTVALHEIGHALGISNANLSFLDLSRDGALTIGGDLPFAGTVIPLAMNKAGVTSHFDPIQVIYGSVMSGVCANERRIPSALDILANAHISGFRFPILDPESMTDTPRSVSSRTVRDASRNTQTNQSGRPRP